MNAEFSLGAGLALCGLGLFILHRLMSRRVSPLAARLSGPAQDKATAGKSRERGDNDAANKSRERLLLQCARIGDTLAGSDNERIKLKNMLHMAGYHKASASGLFMCAKTAAGLISALLFLMLLTSPGSRLSLAGFAFAALGYFIGSTLPEFYLKWQAARRGERLSRAVPDALDLMVICAEAGLPMGRLMAVVAREIRLSAPEMAQELALTVAELNIANDRSRALQHLADRTHVREIESMVSTLIQAEAYGTPLSQALRNISDDSRKTLILGLEEKAGKLPAQMSVPLMTLILPPIVVVMGAPALVRLVRMLTA